MPVSSSRFGAVANPRRGNNRAAAAQGRAAADSSSPIESSCSSVPTSAEAGQLVAIEDDGARARTVPRQDLEAAVSALPRVVVLGELEEPAALEDREQPGLGIDEGRLGRRRIVLDPAMVVGQVEAVLLHPDAAVSIDANRKLPRARWCDCERYSSSALGTLGAVGSVGSVIRRPAAPGRGRTPAARGSGSRSTTAHDISVVSPGVCLPHDAGTSCPCRHLPAPAHAVLVGCRGTHDRMKFARAPGRSDAPGMNKLDLVTQLARQLESSARVALSARDAAAAEAREGATPDEKREDARAAHQLASLGRQQQRRAQFALADADRLLQFKPATLPANAAIAIGAIVEIEDADTGEGRTFFLAPVGAGITLTGPGGDGHLSVVTPMSPLGKAVLGRRTGDVIDISVDGELREWQITHVG
jgi:transcription elongation GreA/GreB family factor